MNECYRIKQLGNGKLGSFGEFLFRQTFIKAHKNVSIETLHRERADFLIKRQKVDVKASRSLNDKFISIKLYPKINRIEGVKYAMVVFYKDCIAISVEKEWHEILRYDKQCNEYYEIWRDKRHDYELKAKASVGKYLKQINLIKQEIKNHFKDKFKCYIIYRSKDAGFGEADSPHNLLPQYKSKSNGKTYIKAKNQARIYLMFRNYELLENNIREIVAYPETQFKKFKILRNAPLSNGWKKIDTETRPKTFLFDTIDDLKGNFIKRFGLSWIKE